MNQRVRGLQDVSIGTHIKVWWSGIPLITRLIFTVNVSIFLIELVFSGYHSSVCLSAKKIVSEWEVYRIVTAAFFHVGVLHIFFNMSGFISTAPVFERVVGSLRFLWMLGVFLVFGGMVYVLLALSLHAIVPLIDEMIPSELANFLDFYDRSCAVGFSGVLFSMSVVMSVAFGRETRSVFGLFTVPSYLYPIVVMIIIQLFVPSASFFGHLSGVIIGGLYVLNLLDWCQLPDSVLGFFERNLMLTRAGSYIAVVSTQSNGVNSRSGSSSISRWIRSQYAKVVQYFREGVIEPGSNVENEEREVFTSDETPPSLSRSDASTVSDELFNILSNIIKKFTGGHQTLGKIDKTSKL